jgi:hypothetical protein
VIPTYSEYIHRFLPRRGKPGEHHFVAVYLLPKVMKIYDCVPDYVNPDGTKKIIGDIVYYKDGQHHFGIEAKLEEIRLTAAEFNNWILLTNSAKHPDVFVAIGTRGLILQTWSRFRAVYCGLKQELLPLNPLPSKKYAPQLGVNALINHMETEANSTGQEVFPICDIDRPESQEQERRFEAALRKLLEKLIPKRFPSAVSAYKS